MGLDEGGEQREPWFSARCVFCKEWPGQPSTYEERVILVRAESEEQAIRIAEEEAEAYVANVEGWSYTGFLDLFHLFDATIGDRTEVFSLMRTSDLRVREYLDKYYDTGSEHARRDDAEL